MNFLKALGLVASAVLALTAPAAATTPTSPAGTAYTGAVEAESEYDHVLIHTKGGSSITCETATLGWEFESHGSFVAAKGPVTNLTFGLCGKTVSVLKKGTIEVEEGAGSFETVTWSGFEITIASGFGDCKYVGQQPTNIMGGLTSSSQSGGGGTTATLHLATNKMPISNSIICPEWIEFTGSYLVTSPDYLDFD